MVTNLQLFGIYEDAIDNAIIQCEKIMREYGFTDKEIDDAGNMVQEELCEMGDFNDITNSIISSYFRVTADLIKQKYKDAEVSYYINCHDSHFNVTGGKTKKYKVCVTDILKRWVEVEAKDEYEAEDTVKGMQIELCSDDYFDTDYSVEEA